MKAIHKRITFEDKFARHYYCNSHRFIHAMKKANHKLFRRLIKDFEW